MSSTPVIWTSEAFSDLESIFDFIHSQSSNAAVGIVKAVLARARQLQQYPESGALHPAIHQNSSKYRYLVEGNYKIIYSYPKNAVYIHAVIDCRQDPYAAEEKLR